MAEIIDSQLMIFTPTTRRDWAILKKGFESAKYETYDHVFLRNVDNAWDVPVDKLNPNIIDMLLHLNKRIEDLEDRLDETP